MTKMQALYNFFASFEIPAYEESSIFAIDIVEFPYITYKFAKGYFQGGEVASNFSVWYRSTSWKDPEEKSNEISRKISLGGIQIPCDDGMIWIKRGDPFCTAMGDDSDKFIKRMYFNITVEFFTVN